MKEIPGYEENLVGAKGAGVYIKHKLGGSVFSF
jgi:hypothetical protein